MNKEDLRKLIQVEVNEVLKEQMDAFDFFSDDEISEPTPVNPVEEEFRQLKRGDVFQLGGIGPKFKVFSSVGDYEKNVTVVGTKGRKFYHTKVESKDPFIVGVYRVLGQGEQWELDTSPYGKPGAPRKV